MSILKQYRGNTETEKVTSAEFTRTLRFIESGGALRILRVLSKLCDESTYIRISNWLVFNASLSECMQFCYLILSMLTAHPKFAGIIDQTHKGPHNTATQSQQVPTMKKDLAGSTFVRACYHVYRIVCAPINKSVYISIPMFLSMSHRLFFGHLFWTLVYVFRHGYTHVHTMSGHISIHMHLQIPFRLACACLHRSMTHVCAHFCAHIYPHSYPHVCTGTTRWRLASSRMNTA